MSEQRSDSIERIEKVMEPVVTAEAESASPDRQPKEFRLYLSDTEACLRIHVPYEGVVTHTTQNRGDKFVGSNKGYLRRSRDELSQQDVIEEFENRTGIEVADAENDIPPKYQGVGGGNPLSTWPSEPSVVPTGSRHRKRSKELKGEKEDNIVDGCPDGFPRCNECGVVFDDDNEMLRHSCSVDTDAGQPGNVNEGDQQMDIVDRDGDEQLAYLTFAHQNAGYVLDGVEDVTIRVGLDRDFTPGQRIELRTPGGTIFAHAVVEKAYGSRVGLAHHDTVVVDGRNHPSESQRDLLAALRGHYPETDIDYDTEVTIIYFDVVDSMRVGAE